MMWVNVNDSLPELRKTVLVLQVLENESYYGLSHRFICHTVVLDGKRGIEVWAGDLCFPDYWMYLPKAPTLNRES